MKQYLDLLREVLCTGVASKDRTGTGVRRLFGAQLRFNLQEGFPLLTTKKMFYKGIFHELLWMLKGTSYIIYLQRNNVHIWDAWADENFSVGPMYGVQWRKWLVNDFETADQLKMAINDIKMDPYSRRMVVSAWNVAEIPSMALPPCHILYQFHANPDTRELSLSMYQRSADIFLGLPFDIGLYALLLSMVAQITEYKVKDLIINLGDIHLYNNHIDQAKIQLSREPFCLPTLVLNPDIKDIDDFKIFDIEIKHYMCHPAIKGEISI